MPIGRGILCDPAVLLAALIPNPPLHKLCNTPKCGTFTAPLVTPPAILWHPVIVLVQSAWVNAALTLSSPSSFSLSPLATVLNHAVKHAYQFNRTDRGTTGLSVPNEHDPLKGTSEARRP